MYLNTRNGNIKWKLEEYRPFDEFELRQMTSYHSWTFYLNGYPNSTKRYIGCIN